MPESTEERSNSSDRGGASNPIGTAFDLAVCSEMVFLDLPFAERVRRIHELGFQVEIWDWTQKDIGSLVNTGATFSSMTGYVRGGLSDRDLSDEMVRTAREAIPVAKELGCPRLVIHGTQLGDDGHAARPVTEVTGAMWMNAARTLADLAELGEASGVTFCLENLNLKVDHPGVPFAYAADTLALVEAVDRPGVRMMLDLYHAPDRTRSPGRSGDRRSAGCGCAGAVRARHGGSELRGGRCRAPRHRVRRGCWARGVRVGGRRCCAREVQIGVHAVKLVPLGGAP